MADELTVALRGREVATKSAFDGQLFEMHSYQVKSTRTGHEHPSPTTPHRQAHQPSSHAMKDRIPMTIEKPMTAMVSVLKGPSGLAD
ncbi:MAG: hypothetical protein AB7Q27_26810, partial [Acidimicrobiia bacterium]